MIYKITDDLRAALEGMLKPDEREVDLGRALVQRAFKISRVGTIAGCRVLSGTVQRNARHASFAKARSSATTRSTRSGEKRTTPRRSAKASNVESNCPVSTTSRKRMSLKSIGSKKLGGHF